jgi:hypothetical protein
LLNKKTPKPIRSAPAKDSGNPKLYDGAGQIVSSEQAGKAVSAFAQLWGTAEFDCGPQDYEFMVKQCVRDSELLSELEKRLPEIKKRRAEPPQSFARCRVNVSVKCPHCGEETGISSAAIFAAVYLSRQQCEHCEEEFLIVDDVPMRQAQYENMQARKPC